MQADSKRCSGVRSRVRRCRGDGRISRRSRRRGERRAARVPTLLEALGYPRPAEEKLVVNLLYVSRRMHLGVPRGLWLSAQEDHWILSAFGYGPAQHPPLDEDAILSFVADVAPPDVLAAIREAEPLGAPAGAFPADKRQR